MTVCRNWASGYCRFGDKCRFEHVQDNDHRSNGPPRGPSQRGPSPNRQGPRNNQRGHSPGGRNNQRRNSPNRNRQGRSDAHRDEVPYKQMTERSIEDDLTIDRPQWFCSAYGPVSGLCATQLFGGAMECSMEEAHCQFYLTALSGNLDAAKAEEEALGARCLTQISNAIQDLPGAVRYLRDGANTRPNRADIVRKANTVSHGDSRRGTRDFFSRENAERRRRQEENKQRRNANNSASSNPFGQTSTPSAPFGQTAPAPQPANSSPFGQPQAPTQFGSGSSFGQPQPAAPFGTPAPFGQAPQPSFGTPTQPQGSGTFGQQPQQNVFGQAPNGASAFGQPQQTGSSFGQTQQSAFGGSQPQPQMNSAFNVPQVAVTAPSAAPQPAQQPTGFGQVPTGPASFSQPAQNGAQPPAAPIPAQAPALAPISAAGNADNGTSFNPDGSLSFWNSHPIHYSRGVPLYKLPSGMNQRVWFPHGEPKETEFFAAHLPPAAEYSDKDRKVYEGLLVTGKFGDDNKLPTMAPRPEWCGWKC